MRDITRAEVQDAVARFLAGGGKIDKVNIKDNGFLLNNDLLMDQNYHSEPSIVDEIKLENILEPEVVN